MQLIYMKKSYNVEGLQRIYSSVIALAMKTEKK